MEVNATVLICVFFVINTLFMLYLMNLPGFNLQPSFITSTDSETNSEANSNEILSSYSSDLSLKKSIHKYFKNNKILKIKIKKV